MSDGRLVDMFDVAFDANNQIYLAVWGTFATGPTNGQFLDVNGAPIGGVFAISSGFEQAGWARVVFGGGKFLVAYTKILSGGAAHQRMAKFVTYAGGAPSLSAELEIDTWSGGAGSAAGLTYSNGRFLVSWWTPEAATPQSYVSVLDSSGGLLADKIQVTTPGDGQTDPEIACDSARGRCLVVGHSWGVFNPAFTPGTWGRFISDANAAPIGAGFTVSYGAIQKEDTVTYSAAGDRFLVTYSRSQNAIYGSKLSASSLANLGESLLRDANMSPEGAGYGNPKVLYNSKTQSSIVAMMPWVAQTAVLELDANGTTVPNTFQFIPGVSLANYNQGTKQVAPAADAINARFLVGDIQAFVTMRSSVFSATAGVPPPPACTISLSSSSGSFGPLGGSAGLTVNATDGCAWTAASNASWVTASPSSGTGSQSITYTVSANNGSSPRSATLTIGGQTYTVSQGVPVLRAAVHDISGDGLSDLLWFNESTHQAAIWELSGRTVLSTRALNGGAAVEAGWSPVGSGDLNADGFADVIWRHSDGRLAAWMMQGTTAIATQVLVFANGAAAVQNDPNWLLSGVGDLNGDGSADLIWQNVNGALAAWMMRGFSVLETKGLSVGAVDPSWRLAGAGDINGDGKADIIFQHSQGALAAWLMNGTQVLTTQYLSANVYGDTGWQIRGVGDVNGDGYADLLWQHTNGVLGVWYLNTFTVTYWNYLSIVQVPDLNWKVVGPG